MEGRSSFSLCCHLSLLLLLLQLPAWGCAEEFLVIGPKDPIVAVLGRDTILPCSLASPMSVENMELRWFRSKFSEAVFVYQNRREQREEQMPEYTGRTSLVRDFLTQGQAAVCIHKVRASDDGQYTCFFKKGDFYEEATLEVKVAGVGSAPQVHIDGPEEGGVRVVCTASGWFPKPQVQWRDPSEGKRLAFSETHVQDADGLFRVEASLVLRDSSVQNVTCSFRNPVLDQEKVKAIFIPEPFFPKASPWKVASAVTLTVLGLLVAGAAYLLYKEHSAKQQAKKRQQALQLAETEDRKETQEFKELIDGLRAELERRKAVYQAAWSKAQLYADWRKEKFPACSVTLNLPSAHPNLVLSQENTSITLKALGDEVSDERCSVLGLQGITSGRCHWEVEVKEGDRGDWAMGVCREGADREGWFRECPEKGFWAVGRFSEEFCVCTIPQTELTLREVPRRLGVFLDHEGGDVSFYNMTDGSHVFSFSQAPFSGTLFPYFMVNSGPVSLTVCSTGDAPQGLSNKSPPLGGQLSPPGEGLGSGSEGDGVLPGPESPLLSRAPQAVSP
ncbi:butyrophilin-like protein 1 [Echinops telfairi]|uniref:Butyrophilin-like protein 1 n=1 Tax=Echinops telfairi TaxID=9371 RepID=A0AC55D8Z2_ECHTE|nr:butyrophilin-like protein 1 [Echinops telfairi]